MANLVPLFITRLDKTADLPDKNAAADLQALICGVLLAITTRLGDKVSSIFLLDLLLQRVSLTFFSPSSSSLTDQDVCGWHYAQAFACVWHPCSSCSRRSIARDRWYGERTGTTGKRRATRCNFSFLNFFLSFSSIAMLRHRIFRRLSDVLCAALRTRMFAALLFLLFQTWLLHSTTNCFPIATSESIFFSHQVSLTFLFFSFSFKVWWLCCCKTCRAMTLTLQLSRQSCLASVILLLLLEVSEKC